MLLQQPGACQDTQHSPMLDKQAQRAEQLTGSAGVAWAGASADTCGVLCTKHATGASRMLRMLAAAGEISKQRNL